jgi:hypothetical protein
MMGEVVGMAASLCSQHSCTPRDIYEKYLKELKELMRAGVGAPPPPPVEHKPPAWLTSAGKNLARSATVTVSGNYRDNMYPARNINDGRSDVRNNALRWVSDSKLPGWVELAWDKPRTINAVRIVTGQAGGTEPKTPIIDFVLQSFDGSVWRDIPGTTVTGNGRFDWHTKFPAVTTSCVRLLVTETPGELTRIWELELYCLDD